MKNTDIQIYNAIREYGLANTFSKLIENFDSQADFAHLSGDKKEENSCRKISVILFEALRKIEEV